MATGKSEVPAQTTVRPLTGFSSGSEIAVITLAMASYLASGTHSSTESYAAGSALVTTTFPEVSNIAFVICFI